MLKWFTIKIRLVYSTMNTHRQLGGHLVYNEHTQAVTFYNCIVPVGFLHGKFGPGKASCDSHSTQPTMNAGCFSVSIIHLTLAWTTGSLTCARMLMHAIAQLVERRTGTPLTQVQFPRRARDFSPRVNFQCRLAYCVCTALWFNRMH